MEIMKNILMLVAMMALGLFVLAGCDKKETAADPHAGHDHAAGEAHEDGADDAEAVAKETETAVTVEQTICPVMGNPINKELYTEYKGKKVYFCCPGCDKLFKENPEKYLAKLPQFGGKEDTKE